MYNFNSLHFSLLLVFGLVIEHHSVITELHKCKLVRMSYINILKTQCSTGLGQNTVAVLLFQNILFCFFLIHKYICNVPYIYIDILPCVKTASWGFSMTKLYKFIALFLV